APGDEDRGGVSVIGLHREPDLHRAAGGRIVRLHSGRALAEHGFEARRDSKSECGDAAAISGSSGAVRDGVILRMPLNGLSQGIRSHGIVAQTLVSARCHLALGLLRWSGPPACHVAIPGDILRTIGISYWKNVG